MKPIVYFLFLIVLFSCKSKTNKPEASENGVESHNALQSEKAPEGMVWIPGGEFLQGAVPNDHMAMFHEKPAHKVHVDGFFMDKHEVTNAQFAKFVKETGYVTVAERAVDWESIEKGNCLQVQKKPHDSILQPGSLVFKKAKSSVPQPV